MTSQNSFRTIGRILSPFKDAVGTPIQPIYAGNSDGKVIVEARYSEALDDIDGFDRIWLLYVLDRAAPFQPRVTPYRDDLERGLFATRSPCRPNPIGLSSVRLLGREGNVLHIAELDVLDETPLLDIKPYVRTFDAHPSAKAGWFDACGVDRTVADGRFHRE